jgi:hypothetical protein
MTHSTELWSCIFHTLTYPIIVTGNFIIKNHSSSCHGKTTIILANYSNKMQHNLNSLTQDIRKALHLYQQYDNCVLLSLSATSESCCSEFALCFTSIHLKTVQEQLQNVELFYPNRLNILIAFMCTSGLYEHNIITCKFNTDDLPILQKYHILNFKLTYTFIITI